MLTNCSDSMQKTNNCCACVTLNKISCPRTMRPLPFNAVPLFDSFLRFILFQWTWCTISRRAIHYPSPALLGLLRPKHQERHLHCLSIQFQVCSWWPLLAFPMDNEYSYRASARTRYGAPRPSLTCSSVAFGCAMLL